MRVLSRVVRCFQLKDIADVNFYSVATLLYTALEKFVIVLMKRYSAIS